jgi:mRNA interferase RelE/StbE
MKKWQVIVMPRVRKQLAAITDRRIQEKIKVSLRRLEYEPEQQGKSLTDELAGFRSVRAVSQRFRIIYKVDEEKVVVLVVTVSIRKEGDKKDAYELAKKLARLGLLDIVE